MEKRTWACSKARILIWLVDQWRPLVVDPWKSSKSNADQEIRLLQDFKDNCDHALAQKAIPESVNAECLGKP